jgi:hypothetical protein
LQILYGSVWSYDPLKQPPYQRLFYYAQKELASGKRMKSILQKSLFVVILVKLCYDKIYGSNENAGRLPVKAEASGFHLGGIDGFANSRCTKAPAHGASGAE